MTKADLVEKIHEKVGMNRKESAEALEMLLEIMKDTLETGENLKICGFGLFSIKAKNSRRGRNPHTGEDLLLDARRVLRFKASSILKKAINV